MGEVDVGQLLTVSGNAAAVAILLERVVWPIVQPSEAAKRRWGSLVAVATGVVLALAALAVTTLAGTPWAPVGEAIVVGAVGGATAVVAHDTVLREDTGGQS